MRIEGAFLRSRTARRIVAFFVASALIPLAVIVALSWDQGWSLQLEAVATAPMAALTSILLASAVLALLVVAVLSAIQIRRTLGPLEKLIDGTRRAGDGDLSARVDVPSGRRIRRARLVVQLDGGAPGQPVHGVAHPLGHRPGDPVPAGSRPRHRDGGHAHARHRSGRLRQHRDRRSQCPGDAAHLHARSGHRRRARSSSAAPARPRT